ncbi:MAG: Maf family protein [Bacteroidetes bacterium]|nr:Maf family protein [Bacteroidota bacterium]
MKLTVPFILASSSPRRSQLLSSVGFSFSVVPADVDETEIPEETAVSMVSRLAILKATVVSNTHPGSLVLGSDTSVEVDGQILGKPQSHQEAQAMLKKLSGRSHYVHTGIALAHKDSDRLSSLVETTVVEFAHLSVDEIEKYVASGTPMDKAGAYGIQDDGGAFFVRGIEGDFYTVMGLPLHRLYTLLRSDFGDLIWD